MPAPESVVLRWVIVGFLLTAGLIVLLGSAPTEPDERYVVPAPEPLRAKPDASGSVLVEGRVLPGTSRYEGERTECEHRLRLETDKGRVFDVSSPGCIFPPQFHDATGLQVRAEGRLAASRIDDATLEPQIGGCCGGPHCYR